MQKIENRDFGGLDPVWPFNAPQERVIDQSIGTTFEVLLPFVKTLAHLQSASEWINYIEHMDSLNVLTSCIHRYIAFSSRRTLKRISPLPLSLSFLTLSLSSPLSTLG